MNLKMKHFFVIDSMKCVTQMIQCVLWWSAVMWWHHSDKGLLMSVLLTLWGLLTTFLLVSVIHLSGRWAQCICCHVWHLVFTKDDCHCTDNCISTPVFFKWQVPYGTLLVAVFVACPKDFQLFASPHISSTFMPKVSLMSYVYFRIGRPLPAFQELCPPSHSLFSSHRESWHNQVP